MSESPNYYAIIPASVRYDNDVPPAARLLFGELSALSNKKGYCYASNDYLASLYDVDKRAIRIWIAHLKQRGHIKVELIKKGEQVTERRIYILMQEVGGGVKNHLRVGKKSPQGSGEKSPPNNTSNNNIVNKVKKTTFDAHDIELIDGVNQAAWTEWLDYKQASKHPYKTSVGITKAMNMLAKYPTEVQQQIIDTSVMNEYRGIFEPKTNGANGNAANQRPIKKRLESLNGESNHDWRDPNNTRSGNNRQVL